MARSVKKKRVIKKRVDKKRVTKKLKENQDEIEQVVTKPITGRRNIRQIIDGKDLDLRTKQAGKCEIERIERVKERKELVSSFCLLYIFIHSVHS